METKSFFKFLQVSLTVIMVLIIFAGCENQPTEVGDYNAEPILYAYPTNGMPFDEISLQRVGSIYSYYRPSGIANCAIWIFDTAAPADTFRFRQHAHPDSSWLYVADGGILTPQGLHQYKIEVFTPQGEYLWAETIVPAAFDTVVVNDSLFVNPPPETDYLIDTLDREDSEIRLFWSKVDSAGGYVGIVHTETPKDSVEKLNPDWDPIEDPIDSTEVNRSGWTIMRDDQVSTTIPWIAFEWVGVYEVQFLAVTRDYYDYCFSYFRSQGAGLGERLDFNVNGGLGVFAGMTHFSCKVYLKKAEL